MEYSKEKKQTNIPPGITQKGRDEIWWLLYKVGVFLPPTWDWSLRNKDGRLTKRIQKYAYVHHEMKLDKELISQIGNLASIHNVENDVFTYDFTEEFDWCAGDFGDSGSCFWSERSEAKDMLMDNGAMAIRFYHEDGLGMGRAWVYPTGDNIIIFNAYGLELVTVAKLLSNITKHSYKRISLENYGVADGTLWINGGIGYVIGPDISHIDGFDFYWDEPEGCECDQCGYRYHSDDMTEAFGQLYCPICREEHLEQCDQCFSYEYEEDITIVDGRTYCEGCRDDQLSYCHSCYEYARNEDAIETDDGARCTECVNENYGRCEQCNTYYRTEHLQGDTQTLCQWCAPKEEEEEHDELVAA